MLVYSDIMALARHDKVLAAYERFLEIRDPDYPDMNYVGLNFSAGKIDTIKFYFSVYKHVREEDVSVFLPCTSDFMRYYGHWEASKVRTGEHTGCAFTVKFRADRQAERGFHYRVKPSEEAFRLIGEPRNLPFSCEEIGSRPGINYAYDPSGKVTRRRYYYLEHQAQKDYIAKRFSKPFASECRLCEYTEFDSGSKVILWTPDYIPRYLKRPLYFDPKARAVVSSLYKDFGLLSAMEGFYEGSPTISTYFFNTLGPKTGNINQGPENFHMDTLSLFLE